MTVRKQHCKTYLDVFFPSKGGGGRSFFEKKCGAARDVCRPHHSEAKDVSSASTFRSVLALLGCVLFVFMEQHTLSAHTRGEETTTRCKKYLKNNTVSSCGWVGIMFWVFAVLTATRVLKDREHISTMFEHD